MTKRLLSIAGYRQLHCNVVILGLTVEVELVRMDVDSVRQMLTVVHRGQTGAQLTVASVYTHAHARTDYIFVT